MPKMMHAQSKAEAQLLNRPDLVQSDQNIARDPSGPARVLIQDAGYDDSLPLVIDRILEAFPRNWAGKSVLVKPNILAPHAPDKGVTTHPKLVRAVVQALLHRKARVMVGDNPGISAYGRSGRAAGVSGIEQAALGCYIPLGQYPVHCPASSRYFDQVTVSRQILEADVIISLPKLKTHTLTVLTAGIKNTFGYVVGGDKMRIHAACPRPRQFAQALVDIYSIRPPDLTILDAVVGMQGNGPANGSPVVLGKIMASDNSVSLDAAAVSFLGQKPLSIPHIQEAAKRGLGEIDPARMKIMGELQPVTNFRFPQTFLPGLSGLILNRCLSRWINCLPEVNTSRCVQCGLCIAHCPVGAMHMTENGPAVQEYKCIHCYCCQELCPEDAIVLTGRLLRFLR
jgi:uncharacterized protein (DUF362 family)/Pyruvate/2-oxoacid:ferredoxin oxidoreductase delta subunit